MFGHKKRGRRCCRGPQNKHICLPHNADFYKTVSKAADFIFTGAKKMCVKVRRLTLFCRRKKKLSLNVLPSISLILLK